MRYEVRVTVKVNGNEGSHKFIKESESPLFAKQEVTKTLEKANEANKSVGIKFEYVIYYCEPISDQRFDIYMSEKTFKDIKKLNSSIAFLSAHVQNDLINITTENVYEIMNDFDTCANNIIGELLKHKKAFRKHVSNQMIEQEIM